MPLKGMGLRQFYKSLRTNTKGQIDLILFLFKKILYCIFSITIYSPFSPFPQQSQHCCPCLPVLFPFR